MYATTFNCSGCNTTAGAARLKGGEVCLWGDAAQVGSGDVFVTLNPYAHGVAELLWSPEAKTHGAPDGARERMHFHHCRLGMRGVPAHPIYFAGAPPCPLSFSPSFGVGATVEN